MWSAELAERLRGAETLMVADYRGLTMTQIDELRTRLLEAGARFTVVKNTLTRLRRGGGGHEGRARADRGPTAIAFLEADGDPVAVAKVLNDTARAHDVLVIRGGILDGAVVGDADIKRLATLPPAEVLQAQLVGAVAGPLTMIVGLFAAPLRDLVGVIDARIRQLEEQGETAPAEPEPQAEPRSRRPRPSRRPAGRSAAEEAAAAEADQQRADRRAVGRRAEPDVGRTEEEEASGNED